MDLADHAAAFRFLVRNRAGQFTASFDAALAGGGNYRLCRYADDWCLVVSGTQAHVEALKEEIAGVLTTMGLRLSPEKTLVTHIDEGVDFLGWRIQRHPKRGTGKQYVYVYPAKKALAAVMVKTKTICRKNTNRPLPVLLHQLNRMLRGWTAYSSTDVRPVSSRTHPVQTASGTGRGGADPVPLHVSRGAASAHPERGRRRITRRAERRRSRRTEAGTGTFGTVATAVGARPSSHGRDPLRARRTAADGTGNVDRARWGARRVASPRGPLPPEP